MLKDYYINKRDIDSRIHGKTVRRASVYTNAFGEETVEIVFKDKSSLKIESVPPNEPLSIKYITNTDRQSDEH